jgi:hypothetical protein
VIVDTEFLTGEMRGWARFIPTDTLAAPRSPYVSDGAVSFAMDVRVHPKAW